MQTGQGARGDHRIAVVIATRNRRDTLRHTLGRLAALPERPQVLVADNGSTDGTAEYVRRAWPGVAVLALPANIGAGARTVAVERLDTPYVAFADDDSWWDAGSLAHAADLFDACPRLGLVAARVVTDDDGRLDPICAQMAAAPLGHDPDLPGPSILGFLACAVVVRREAFLAAGGFDGRLLIGGEEELLALDLAAAGWGLAYVDDLVAHHRPSPIARSPARRRRVVARNHLWTSWLRLPVAAAVRETAVTLRTAWQDPAVRPAVLDALRGAGWVVRERRVLPADVERARRALAG